VDLPIITSQLDQGLEYLQSLGVNRWNSQMHYTRGDSGGSTSGTNSFGGFPFFQLPKTAIAAATTTNYSAADAAPKPNRTIAALFTYGKVNSKLLAMYLAMSDFAFFRFMSNNILTEEEKEHKEEIIQLTEEILQAKGIQCDASISKIPAAELIEILEKVRELRRRKKKKQSGTEVIKEEDVYIHNR
jgi:hypothetical protein